jgi:rod shape-determining protein MreB
MAHLSLAHLLLQQELISNLSYFVGSCFDMLRNMLGVMQTELAIDLGTANTLVYTPVKGIILDEPSVVAMFERDGRKEVLAVGRRAKAMIGRTPENIETIRPMRDGVIADFVAAEEMIKQFIRMAISRISIGSPRIMMCVPASATQVECRAVHDAAWVAGARKIHIMQEPVAAAIGAGLDISEARGSLVMDIGGGTTDIAVMSLGGVIVSRSFRVAGDAMDDAIINHIRKKHHLLVGQTNAELIKKEVGSALVSDKADDVDVQIKGRNLKTGMPSEIVLGPSDIAEALQAPLRIIADEVARTLEELPPELAADIAEEGIYITGGGALLDGVDEALGKMTGMKFHIPTDPLRCVVIGAGLALENLEQIGDLLVEVQ